MNLPETIAKHQKLAKAIAECARLDDQRGAAITKLQELEAGRRAAVDKDRDAYARALREGKADPGEKHTREADEAIRAAGRKAEALKVAVTAADGELAAIVEAHRGELLARLGGSIVASHAEFAAAVAKLDEARLSLMDDLKAAGWLHEFPKRRWKHAGRAPGGEVVGLDRGNGEPYGWHQVIAALHAETERLAQSFTPEGADAELPDAA